MQKLLKLKKMRRSFAPSNLKTGSPKPSTSNGIKQVVKPVLILKKPINIQPRNENKNNSAGKLSFSVVYGAISGRKHKVYDSDGFIEFNITSKNVVLKDTAGKVIINN